jgi:hypothetical protein
MGNVVPADLGPFPQLNPEFVLRAQPHIVMAAQRNLDDMPRRPGWKTLRALQERRTCGFEVERQEVLVRPGPRMGEAAMALAECLVAIESAQGLRAAAALPRGASPSERGHTPLAALPAASVTRPDASAAGAQPSAR